MRYFVACLAVLAGLAFGGTAQASSHTRVYESLNVQPLLHNQLNAMDANRPAIVALAEKLLPTDTEVVALRHFIIAQRRACMGGVVPAFYAGMEGSPFHLCTHAFLAGTQALLKRLELVAGHRLDVQVLSEQVKMDLLADGAGPVCVNSATSFNTDTIHGVDWPDLKHPSRSTLVVVFGFVFLFVVVHFRRRRLQAAQ
ncbi:MAG TPA: hypothetical protein VHP58_06510 [Alphaproteobacteria bacterium]|nr:hypothetical protein [Alphaproteobacteria bacterium]